MKSRLGPPRPYRVRWMYGTVFKINSSGAFTALVGFGGTNGAKPQPGLALGSDGHYYGTTSEGGDAGSGVF